MKNYLWTYLFTFIAGVLLLVLCDYVNLYGTLIFLLGLLFILPGVAAVVAYFLSFRKREKGSGTFVSPFRGLAGILAVLFGILLICLPKFFIGYLVFTFGAVLIMSGILQFFILWTLISRKKRVLPYLIVPAVLLCGGIWLIAMGNDALRVLANIVTGIGLIAFSINGFAGYFKRDRDVTGKREGSDNNIDKGIVKY